ncbi:hypothetical protein ACQ4M4_18335 [Leptolyngbya sp. AN02str]|uniref:hypothetical protein n=1 Tax=Leptolyngbya sp. AN02str TaxID=3423363 RepID=UPI003D31A216
MKLVLTLLAQARSGRVALQGCSGRLDVGIGVVYPPPFLFELTELYLLGSQG